MARARLARPTGVFCRRSHPTKVARVWSSISIWIAVLRPCIALSWLMSRAGVVTNPLPPAQFFLPFSMGSCTKYNLFPIMSKLESEAEVLAMGPGDFVYISVHRRHRVEWTGYA